MAVLLLVQLDPVCNIVVATEGAEHLGNHRAMLRERIVHRKAEVGQAFQRVVERILSCPPAALLRAVINLNRIKKGEF